MSSKYQSDLETTMVTVSINAETNRLLTEAAKISGRSKKIEAEIRLIDHLARFQLFLTEEVVKKRDSFSRVVQEKRTPYMLRK